MAPVLAAALTFAMLAAPALAPVGWAAVPPGLPDPGQAGHAAKCQKMMDKGVAKYVKTWSKAYAKCVGALAACAQTKGGDPACVAKATTACNKKIPKLGNVNDGDLGFTLLEDPVVSFCGSLTLSAQLGDAGGVDYDLRADECKNRFGIPSIASGIGSIAFCLFKETTCAAQSMLLVQFPRARQMLDDAGITVDPGDCLPNVGGSGALGEAKAGKALLKCESGATKVGQAFAAKARGAYAKCAEAIFGCAQLKPGDQKCVDKAGATCAKLIGKADEAEAKATAAVTKGCAKIPLADLTGVSGGDVSALASICGGVGVASLDTLDDYAECLTRRARCEIEESITFTSPRVVELFDAAGQTFGSAFCAPS